MNRFVRSLLTLAASIVFFAQPAAADDGRRHVMTATQKIDMVRDLPDTSEFERDGVHFDLGYIYPIHTVNGASVASAGGDRGFVLYNGDRYARLTASDVAELQFVLGEDPTQGYTPPKPSSSRASAAADPWGANAGADDSRGQPVASQPVRSSSSRRGGGIIATLFLLFVVLFLRMRLFRDLVIGGVIAAIAAIARRGDKTDFGPGSAGPSEAFTAQASAQRARLDALSGTPASTPRAAATGFGRKQA